MTGCERQDAGVTPAELMEEGFRERWAILHPGEDIPQETAALFERWKAKWAARRAAPAPPPADDDDPFAEDYPS